MEDKEKYWNDYIDHIIDLLDSIQLHKVTVLTGRNGGGKSMMRKLLLQFLKSKDELQDKKYGQDWILSTVSMDDRAGVNPDRMMVFGRDCEWLPTSENTFNDIDSVLKTHRDGVVKYIVLDELEIGMGEELQAGLAAYLNDKILALGDACLGVLIITHSRAMVRNLKYDDFINLEGMTDEEWINRKVIPMSPSELLEKSRDLHIAFSKRLKQE